MSDSHGDGTSDEPTTGETADAVDPTEYYDVLAPLPDALAWTELDALSELLAGIYDQGVELSYHDYPLRNLGSPGSANAWGVVAPGDGEDRFVAVVNLAGFRDVAELQAYLDELVAVAPETRTEWVEHRRADGTTSW